VRTSSRHLFGVLAVLAAALLMPSLASAYASGSIRGPISDDLVSAVVEER